MENPNIPEVIRTTANNMFELLTQLADHIEKLEKENNELKLVINRKSDDFK